jgi:hypothetical protein
MAQAQPSSPTISDDDRDKLEEALAVALLQIYAGKRATALAQLGQTVDALDVPPAASQKVLDFARERARLIQEGVNERMSGADDPTAVASEIDQYNRDHLQPWMDRWAQNRGVSDAYAEVPATSGTGTMRDEKLWVWTQNSSYNDSCSAAAAASPATWDELVTIAGGEPQTHNGCKCDLSPQ